MFSGAFLASLAEKHILWQTSHFTTVPSRALQIAISEGEQAALLSHLTDQLQAVPLHMFSVEESAIGGVILTVGGPPRAESIVQAHIALDLVSVCCVCPRLALGRALQPLVSQQVFCS